MHQISVRLRGSHADSIGRDDPTSCEATHAVEEPSSGIAMSEIGGRLRDGVLQDITAISMLILGARQALHRGVDPREVDRLLAQAQSAAEGDLEELRAVIDDLRPAA